MQKLKSGIKSKFESDLTRYIFYKRRFEKGLKWVLLITYLLLFTYKDYLSDCNVKNEKYWFCNLTEKNRSCRFGNFGSQFLE